MPPQEREEPGLLASHESARRLLLEAPLRYWGCSPTPAITPSWSASARPMTNRRRWRCTSPRAASGPCTTSLTRPSIVARQPPTRSAAPSAGTWSLRRSSAPRLPWAPGRCSSSWSTIPNSTTSPSSPPPGPVQAAGRIRSDLQQRRPQVGTLPDRPDRQDLGRRPWPHVPFDTQAAHRDLGLCRAPGAARDRQGAAWLAAELASPGFAAGRDPDGPPGPV